MAIYINISNKHIARILKLINTNRISKRNSNLEVIEMFERYISILNFGLQGRTHLS